MSPEDMIDYEECACCRRMFDDEQQQWGSFEETDADDDIIYLCDDCSGMEHEQPCPFTGKPITNHDDVLRDQSRQRWGR